MDRKLIEALFEKGIQKGFSAQEIYYQTTKQLQLSVYNGEVDKFKLSEDAGLSYRGILDGKMGYAYTEILDAGSLERLLDEAKENAKVIESDDLMFLHDGTGKYHQMNLYNPDLSKHPIEDKINFMLELEKKVKGFDPRVTRVSNNLYSESEVYRWIKNTEGLDMDDSSNYCLAYAIAIAEESGDTRTGLGYDITNDFNKLDPNKIVTEACREAISMLGAKSMISSQIPVVFKNETFAEFFSAFMGLFSAERVQKNLSAFKGRIDQTIASDLLTLVDDPHVENGLGSSSFDAEGVATFKKHIIDKGVLKTFLHNLKTANKDNISTTGNASKGSYKGTIGISPFNLYLEKGSLSLDDLLGRLEHGIFITGLQGLHAGLDSISGDFSLQCHGYEITGGKTGRPVSQITVSGNFFDLLNQISGVADDLTFSILASSYMGSPSISVEGLTISGE